MKLPLALLLAICFCPITDSQCVESGNHASTTHLETKRRRYFYVDEHTLPIRIETSRRESHILISEILKILLKEVIGYAQVEVVVKDGPIVNATGVLGRISGCESPAQCESVKPDHIPETMISLEVWLTPAFDMESWTATGRIDDSGPLGPIGRAGWFISEDLVRRHWETKGIILDHWRAFQREDHAALFHIVLVQRYLEGDHGYHCKEPQCENGIYRPPQCKSKKSRCATLLADYPKYTLSFLKNDIEKLKLYVEVAYVGKDLGNIISDRVPRQDPVIFFSWKPNILTLESNFTHISFPHCEDERPSHNLLSPSLPFSPCEFELNQIEKIVWSKIRTNAPDVYHVVRAMTFQQNEYLELLELYHKRSKYGKKAPDVACMWVFQHDYIWHNWIPGDIGHKHLTLNIGGIFPLSGASAQKGLVSAAQMAVDDVNNNDTVLKDYKLELLQQDGACQADRVMTSFISYVTNSSHNKLVGILGPACSETVEPIAGVAKHFHTVIVSYSAEGGHFSNRDNYEYFFRTIAENNLFRFVYLELFKKLGWRRVAALTEEGQKAAEYISNLQDMMQTHDMNFITNRKFPRTLHNMTQYLIDLKSKNARIIIGEFVEDAARRVMCEAYKQNMTAYYGYQWFLPTWYNNNWFDTDEYNTALDNSSMPIPCTTKEMSEAINGHMRLTYKFYAADDQVMQTGKTVKEWRNLYYQVSHQSEQDKDINDYGGYAYDAVWVFAKALDTLFKEDHSHLATLHSPRTAKRFIDLLNKTDFTGVSDRVHFVGNSRITEVFIWQWQFNQTLRVGVYVPLSASEGRLELNETLFLWLLRGVRPGDGTIVEEQNGCAVEALRRILDTSCDIAIFMANLIGFVLFLFIMLIGCCFFKRKYEEKVKRTEERMRALGLTTTKGILTLDEWEMPRDHIVINRKLGEGAFGTVYGGEAFVEEKGWVAVAVKTLKIGANIEEKLDFLSEAEMMKRFDHANIVRLQGVCTVGEPVYTVMEFMLYGDLKTYLLARRNLVNERDRNSSDEVSDKQLTNMSVDIARGLSYLAELKYVHRDLACRNCLVNAGRVVKIADFGMCRPMYDSDYYRFNKRGMLPVRWMAPESLIDGLFTTMSDVWSFGVLLYEVVTFGSFPYQGLSNNQVLDFVKDFNTLPVPKGCSPELESLLMRCWSRSPSQRPAASEIVEILATHSELIRPCLDMPLASVEVEDTDSIELAINNDRTRVHSISSSNTHPTRRHATNPIAQELRRHSLAHVSENGSIPSPNMETAPLTIHTHILPTKGQYVTFHCKDNRENMCGATVELRNNTMTSL